MNQMQKLCREAMERYSLSTSPAVRALDAVSELGELAKELLKASDYGARQPAATPGMIGEMGDCLFAMLNLCNALGIDAGEALSSALEKYERRFRERGVISSGR